MEQKEKITFESLTPTVQTALRLLKKKKDKAILGVGHYFDCPIAKAYDIRAFSLWSNLYREDLDILKKEGWNSRLYLSFLNWYDGSTVNIAEIKKRASFLKEFLE